MGSDATDDLMTTRQAAEYLGVSPQSIYWYVKTNRLKRARRVSGGRGGKEYLFNSTDVRMLIKLREDKQPRKLDEIVLQAARTEAKCVELEHRLNQLMEVLGMNIEPLDLDPQAVREKWNHAKWLANYPNNMQPEVDEVRDFGKFILRITEEYLSVVGLTTGDPNPWRTFFEAASMLTHIAGTPKEPEMRAAVYYLELGRRSLYQITFGFIRKRHGVQVAEDFVKKCDSEIDEAIVGWILSDALRPKWV